MSKYNKQLIEKLKNGEIALEYDNKSLKDLTNILKEAFSNDRCDVHGISKYYFTRTENYWTNTTNTIDMKSVPIKDFIQEEFVLPKKWCIKPVDDKQLEIIYNHVDKNGNSLKRMREAKSTIFYYHFPATNNRDFFAYQKPQKGYTEITFEQFKEHVLKEKQETMEKYKFTVDYVNNNDVIIECKDSDEAKKVNRLINGFNGDCEFSNFKHVVYLCKMRYYCWLWQWQDEGINKQYTNYFQRNYPNIEFEIVNATEFIKNNTKMENKEIIGYKAPYDLYEGKVKKGTLYIKSQYNKIYYHTDNGEYAVPKEIVETWEPVYKPKEQVFNMGSFEVVVKDGKAFHKNDDITSFIIGLVAFNYKAERIFEGFKAEIDEVIFKRTGCEHNQTKLSDWKKVYNALNQ